MTIRLTRSTRKCSRASEREMQRRHAKRGKKESLYLKEMKKEDTHDGKKAAERNEGLSDEGTRDRNGSLWHDRAAAAIARTRLRHIKNTKRSLRI